MQKELDKIYEEIAKALAYIMMNLRRLYEIADKESIKK